SLGMKGTEGALVTEPQADSPAAKAGVLSGDVITAVNGHAVKNARDLARQIGAMASGSDVKLTVWRKGEEKSIALTVGAQRAVPGSAQRHHRIEIDERAKLSQLAAASSTLCRVGDQIQLLRAKAFTRVDHSIVASVMVFSVAECRL